MIIFKTIRWKNFLSTGDQFTEIPLSDSKNTLIVGENGSGKSTLLDALSYVLFGRAFRNINNPQLINNLNEEDCLVEVEFKIARNNYFIRRGMKPNIFEIHVNDKMVDQDSRIKDYQNHLERNILKLNFKSFCQVVVLGSASFVPFMQLKPNARRFIIEDLLDIQIFSAMNIVLKQKLADLKYDENDADRSISVTEEKVKVHKRYLDDLKKDNKEQIVAKKNLLKENETERSKLSDEYVKFDREKDQLLEGAIQYESVKTRIRKMEHLEEQLRGSRKKVEEEINFFRNNENCPTCKQAIGEEFKQETIKVKELKAKEIEDAINLLTKDLEGNQGHLTRMRKILEDVQAKEALMNSINGSIQAIDSYVAKVQKEIDSLQKKKVSDESKNQISQLEEELASLMSSREQFVEERHYHEVVGIMLRDSGIKTKIIRQYLPIINKLVNRYLTALDFFVNFTLDETFRESIKSRGRDDFSYESFSEGEKMRIDLSLLFTWREVARLKNSANTNLLVLDEIFDSSMDASGIDDFLKLMGELQAGVNIFIISHRGDTLLDKFDNVIRFSKRSNFSMITVD